MHTRFPPRFVTVSCRTGIAAAYMTANRLLLLWVLLSALLGAVLRTACPALPAPALLMQGLRITDAPCTLWDICRNALFPQILLLCMLLLSGVSAIGQPFALLALLLRGGGIGAAAADSLLRFGMRAGLSAAAVLVLPFGYCSALILVRGAETALRLSSALTRYFCSGQADGEFAAKRSALLRQFPMLTLCSLTACGLHTVLVWLFHDLPFYGS